MCTDSSKNNEKTEGSGIYKSLFSFLLRLLLLLNLLEALERSRFVLGLLLIDDHFGGGGRKGSHREGHFQELR